MANLERGFSLYKDVQIRSNDAISINGVIFAASDTDAEFADSSFSYRRFSAFKVEHPETQHPLVDYLKANHDQKAKFPILLHEYPAILHLFSHSDNWQKDGDEQFLSFKDASTIFEPSDRPGQTIETDRQFYWNLDHHYNVWREKVNPEVKLIPGYSNNIFHRREEIKNFLMFMLDQIAGRNGSKKPVSEIQFSKAQEFKPILTKTATAPPRVYERLRVQPGERYGMSVFPEILKKNGKISDLYKRGDLWLKKGEKMYLSFRDMASLFALSDGTPNTYDRNSVFLGKMKKVLKDWKKQQDTGIDSIEEPGYRQNRLYEKKSVTDFILFAAYRIDFNRVPSSVYAKIMLSADEKFEPVVTRNNIKDANLRQYQIRHGLVEPKNVGRPRIHSVKDPSEKRPRGRPRIHPVQEGKKPKKRLRKIISMNKEVIRKPAIQRQRIIFSEQMRKVINRVKMMEEL